MPEIPVVQYNQPCTDCDDVCPSVSNELTEHCTDQCVVIACRDPTHDAQVDCTSHQNPGHCNLVCDSATNCGDCHGFDTFLQCCSYYHEYFADHKANHDNSAHAPPGWDTSSWSWCNDCNDPPASVTPSPATARANLPIQYNRSEYIAPEQNDQLSCYQSLPEKCMWSNCNAAFATLSDLVGHVNLIHLRPSNASAQQQIPPAPIQMVNTSPDFDSSLSCLWDHCSTSVMPQIIPGPSSAPELNSNPFSALETHLLRDHLGLDLVHLASLRNQKLQQESAPAPPSFDFPSPPSEGTVSKQTSPSAEAQQCNWKDCSAQFASCDELTNHLNTVHVGGGKAHYECFWEGCNRNGAQGFSSKQKICRHLQSHTGHRPFQCKICQQNFSEAATLQQHMRRHTQERPYACDFPGCGKSFAIMGALTIHKRIHNGIKPFKCKFCDKAFSESSNLSKHLRTHTGARPYVCQDPGCGKTFARPDQLNRHMSVHRKATDGRGTLAQ